MFSEKKIIVVEDNELNTYFLKIIFKPTNAHITFCINSIEFFENYNDKYDLVLLDIMIPGEFDGIDILKKIRKSNKNIPIIMQSAYTEKYNDCIEAGATDFIEKPITYTHMINKLKKYLNE